MPLKFFVHIDSNEKWSILQLCFIIGYLSQVIVPFYQYAFLVWVIRWTHFLLNDGPHLGLGF